jgi:hypothetical protein
VTDEELARAALLRTLEFNLIVNKHAPIHIGAITSYAGQTVQSLLMMRPCRCGRHVAQALFMGPTPEAAMREARFFVEALVSDDERG